MEEVWCLLFTVLFFFLEGGGGVEAPEAKISLLDRRRMFQALKLDEIRILYFSCR